MTFKKLALTTLLTAATLFTVNAQSVEELQKDIKAYETELIECSTENAELNEENYIANNKITTLENENKKIKGRNDKQLLKENEALKVDTANYISEIKKLEYSLENDSIVLDSITNPITGQKYAGEKAQEFINFLGNEISKYDNILFTIGGQSSNIEGTQEMINGYESAVKGEFSRLDSIILNLENKNQYLNEELSNLENNPTTNTQNTSEELVTINGMELTKDQALDSMNTWYGELYSLYQNEVETSTTIEANCIAQLDAKDKQIAALKSGNGNVSGVEITYMNGNELNTFTSEEEIQSVINALDYAWKSEKSESDSLQKVIVELETIIGTGNGNISNADIDFPQETIYFVKTNGEKFYFTSPDHVNNFMGTFNNVKLELQNEKQQLKNENQELEAIVANYENQNSNNTQINNSNEQEINSYKQQIADLQNKIAIQNNQLDYQTEKINDQTEKINDQTQYIVKLENTPANTIIEYVEVEVASNNAVNTNNNSQEINSPSEELVNTVLGNGQMFEINVKDNKYVMNSITWNQIVKPSVEDKYDVSTKEKANNVLSIIFNDIDKNKDNIITWEEASYIK